MGKRARDKSSVAPAAKPTAEIVDIQESGVALSVNRFCDEARCDNATIARRIKVARIEPVGKNARENRYRLADLLQCAYLMDDDGNFNPSGLDPFKRKAHFQAAQEEVKYRADCGELVPKIEMEAAVARAIKIHSHWCATAPDMLERDCALTPAQIESVRNGIEKMQREFVAALIAEDADDSEHETPVHASA